MVALMAYSLLPMIGESRSESNIGGGYERSVLCCSKSWVTAVALCNSSWCPSRIQPLVCYGRHLKPTLLTKSQASMYALEGLLFSLKYEYVEVQSNKLR